MNVTIIGCGFVGLTTGALLAAAGNKVYCVDVDKKRIEMVKQGKPPFYEPGLKQLLKKTVQAGKLIATTSYKEAMAESEIAIICVGTPANPDGSVNLEYIFQAVRSMLDHLTNNMIIVLKSTVQAGTGREVEKMFKKSRHKIDLVSCPEFLAEGSAIFDTLNMDRLVVGGDSATAKNKVIELFTSIDKLSRKTDLTKYDKYTTVYENAVKNNLQIPFSERVLSISLESAELVKITANAFLASKISFANSIARLCDVSGANIEEVMEGIGRDRRIGNSFLKAGIGWGGSCFPKDTEGLLAYANNRGIELEIVKAARKINADQVKYIITKIKDIFNGNLKEISIGVLGLAFKPGTSDVRYSPAISLVQLLLKSNKKIKVFDPQATSDARQILADKVTYANDLNDLIKDTHLLILATEWPEFVNLDFDLVKKLMKKNVLFDARNKWDRNSIEDAGLKYFGIGK